MEYKYKISVVMAVYNVEKYIDDAVESVLNQTIGFENIQIIFVEDGTPDNCAAICDKYAAEYPNNITVIHKNNEGLAKARVDGIRVAEGKYISFFDPDDILDKNTFLKMYNFFEIHSKEVDVVGMPQYFFDEQTGPHPLNYKFKKGSRVVDLFQEYDCIHMSLNASLIKNEVAHLIEADSDIVTAEDAKELIKILLLKNKIGYVADAKHNYRKTSTSSVGGAPYKKGWYITYLNNFSQYALDYSKNKLGFVPKYIQYMVMYDLQWKFRMENIPENVLTAEEQKVFMDKLFEIIDQIDDSVIMGQKFIGKDHKYFLLKKKYDDSKKIISNDVKLVFSNDAIFDTSGVSSFMNSLDITGDKLVIDFHVQLYSEEFEDSSIVIAVNDNIIENFEQIKRTDFKDKYSLGTKIASYKGMIVEIPLEDGIVNKITISLKKNDNIVELRKWRYSTFFPISRKFKNNSYIKNNWKVTLKKHHIFAEKIDNRKIRRSEISFIKELIRSKNKINIKAAFVRIIVAALRTIKTKPVWIISDRVSRADDNGEAFFKYLCKEHKKDVTPYFVISKESEDYNRLKKYGKVVPLYSYRHKIIHLLSDVMLSSQTDDAFKNPFRGSVEPYRDLLNDVKFVFLQHGVIGTEISGWLRKDRQNFKGFVTTTKDEYDSIINGLYNYPEKQVWLTGMPRFDYLNSNPKRVITFMPTWRRYLASHQDQKTGFWVLKQNIKDSKCIKYYNEILNNEKLISACKKHNYNIEFKLHPSFQGYEDMWNFDDYVSIIPPKTSYREIYERSNLIITDYSSSINDFIYMKKPIIYTQFDYGEFFSGAHNNVKEGYFNYEDDGFGEVEYTLEDTVNRIIEYMENDCQLKDKYRKRIDSFFAFNDKNNCQRVYDKIMELENRND